MEAKFIELDNTNFKCKLDILIGCIYRPPKGDITKFTDKLVAILSNVAKNKTVYLIDVYYGTTSD